MRGRCQNRRGADNEGESAGGARSDPVIAGCGSWSTPTDDPAAQPRGRNRPVRGPADAKLRPILLLGQNTRFQPPDLLAGPGHEGARGPHATGFAGRCKRIGQSAAGKTREIGHCPAARSVGTALAGPGHRGERVRRADGVCRPLRDPDRLGTCLPFPDMPGNYTSRPSARRRACRSAARASPSSSAKT